VSTDENNAITNCNKKRIKIREEEEEEEIINRSNHNRNIDCFQ
jgi:hypothetical protein